MFFIDVFVEYLIRVLARFVKEIRTKSWPRVSAEVVSAESDSGVTALRLARVHFRYQVDGVVYEGSDTKPFFNLDYRDQHLRKHPPGTRMGVVVNPKDPTSSFLRNPFWFS